MKQPVSAAPSVLEGVLERITFCNPQTHYTVAVVKPHKAGKPVTVVGFMAGVRAGETLRITGAWETHPRFGEQLKVTSYAAVIPDAADDVRKYLSSGIIKGIGPVMAQRIAERFGAGALEIIGQHPHRLCEVEGIGEAKAAAIHAAWQDQQVLNRLMPFLQRIGLKSLFHSRIIKAYGLEAEAVIRANPYRLALDIPGISFFAADAAARKLGTAEDDPERIRACIRHLLHQSIKDGHMYIPESRLRDQCQKLLGISHDFAAGALSAMARSEELVVDPGADGAGGDAVYLKMLYQAESGLAERLKALLSVPVPPLEINAKTILDAVQRKLALNLSEDQLKALEGILAHRAVVITGGPGTGKTTLIRSVSAIYERLSKQVLLTAPTGRAARRLAEITDREARTIHKALGYNLETEHFDRHPGNPLQADALIVDEASMVDAPLMFHLLRAMPLTAHLVLVGDVFQLPPVGPGTALADIIASGRIPTYYLTRIFRQAQESPIIINAHHVRRGNPLDLQALIDPGAVSEFCFLAEADPQKVVDRVVELSSRILPERFSLDPLADIQVLCPMHKGLVGILHLNQVLQQALNPNPDGLEYPAGPFRTGDKVMHLKNNYQKDVFNGDIGVIQDIDRQKGLLSVDFDERRVQYDRNELDELTLAYAVSVHKSQGSEYPAVIMPLTTQHFPLLQRNLLYTAITRGQTAVVLVGSARALQLALLNDKPRQRLSRLAQRLED